MQMEWRKTGMFRQRSQGDVFVQVRRGESKDRKNAPNHPLSLIKARAGFLINLARRLLTQQ